MVVDRSPTDEVRYYSSTDEWRDHVIAQARIKADTENKINSAELLNARSSGETNIYTAEEVDLMDVATNQAVSVAASLIPFLQNDDAHRALMVQTCNAKVFLYYVQKRRLLVQVC